MAEAFLSPGKRLIIAAFLFTFVIESSAQQHVQFTQYMLNNVVINPAYAGADEALSMTFIQRSQWTGIKDAPETQTLSAHTLFKKRNIGLGLTLVNDKIGVHKNINALTNYAYHLKVSRKYILSMGVGAGIRNQRSDYASLVGNSNYDPKVHNAILSHTFLSFAMGAYLRGPRLHVGISSPEVVPKKLVVNDSVSIRLSNTNLLLFSKYRITINEDIDLEPGILVKYFSNVPVSFDLNGMAIYRKVLALGLSYRRNESIDFIFKGQITPQLQFGYSYDHSIGDISRLSNGSHEIMVHYLFKYIQKNVSSPR